MSLEAVFHDDFIGKSIQLSTSFRVAKFGAQFSQLKCPDQRIDQPHESDPNLQAAPVIKIHHLSADKVGWRQPTNLIRFVDKKRKLEI